MTSSEHPLARVRRVRVGSTNAPKIGAAVAALEAYAPDAMVEGAAVDSGVSEQPVGFEEISRGARNRAHAAFATGECDLAVGYEDGLVELTLSQAPSELWNVGCAAVTDGIRTSFGLSSGFGYPPQCAEQAARERAPIGDLFDALWAAEVGEGSSGRPSARDEGNIGKLSLGALTRSDYARHAIVCALVRFLHPGLYGERVRQDRSVA